MFSCEYCEIINNSFFIEHVRWLLLKTKNAESRERRKTSVRKEIVKNADLHKPVLNKIMTAQEECGKYDFVAKNALKLLKSLLKYYFDKIFS